VGRASRRKRGSKTRVDNPQSSAELLFPSDDGSPEAAAQYIASLMEDGDVFTLQTPHGARRITREDFKSGRIQDIFWLEGPDA